MKRPKKTQFLEDGSPASTGHKPKEKRQSQVKIISVDENCARQIELDRQIEAYAFKIRNEAKLLSKLTEEISAAYSQYAESNDRIDSSPSIHNGLGNMMKLIEVQTTTKLRIKKMQTAIMQAIAANTPDDELPYAMQDIMREVNVNFLDSKLVRAYGEIAKIMKEDLELAKISNNEIQFANGDLTSELETMPAIETELVETPNVEDDYGETEEQ